MKKEDLRIVYMGTPEFAVEPLRCLVEGGYNIVGVITMPDKPAGRGHKVQFSPVKQYALEHDLPLLQPERLKDEAFVEALRAWNADLQIVVAFRMLPEVVWNMPRLGTFNLHASLLPQYRGAAPINWAVINGDTETGITTFFLKHEIDTGEVIQQVRVPIADTDNVGIVHDKLMMLGGRLVTETVDAILADTVKSVPQEEMAVVGELRPAPKIFKDTCRIDWNQPVKRIYDFIRGLSPYPAAWTELVQPDGTAVVLKIFETEKIEHLHESAPGTLQTDGKTYIRIAGTDVMLNYMLPEQFSAASCLANLQFYEPRTIHDSSLSKAIHGIVAARCGLLTQSYQFWREGTEIDLGADPHSCDDGIHAAATGAIWLGAIQGFAGVSVRDGELHLNPALPEQWQQLSFPLFWQGCELQVTLDAQRIAIRTSAPVSLRLNGQLISVAEESVFCLGDFILPFNGTATTHQEDE